MTEGPTARYRAEQIGEKFGGKILRDIFVRSKKVYVEPAKLIGKKLERATSYGKNILLYFNGYLIRIHLMMYGSIRFEREYSKPRSQIRLALSFEDEIYQHICQHLHIYNAPIVEIGLAHEIEKMLFEEYGIDPLTNWDEKKLVLLILGEEDRKIGDVLLDQRIFSGVGNILRNEILFRAGVNPERKVGELSRKEIEKIVLFTKSLCEDFLNLKREGKGIKEILMVYNRKTCKKCNGEIIHYKQNPNGRKTFYCVNCQPINL